MEANGNGNGSPPAQYVRLVCREGAIEVRLSEGGSYQVGVKRPHDTGWRQSVSGNIKTPNTPVQAVPDELDDAIELPGGLVIDVRQRVCTIRGTQVKLANREFQLLAFLARDPYRCFTKDQLLREVWGYQSQGATRTLDSHASRMRGKFREHGYLCITNVWGVGYKLLDASMVAA